MKKWRRGSEDGVQSTIGLPLPKRQWAYDTGEKIVTLDMNPGNMLFNPYYPWFFVNIETPEKHTTILCPGMRYVRNALSRLRISNRPHYREAYWKMREDMKRYKDANRHDYELCLHDRKTILRKSTKGA